MIDYRCGFCSKGGCRLWREWAGSPKLACVACARARGLRTVDTTCLDVNNGDWVPAIPITLTAGFHTHESASRGDRQWWQNLPLQPLDRTVQNTLDKLVEDRDHTYDLDFEVS